MHTFTPINIVHTTCVCSALTCGCAMDKWAAMHRCVQCAHIKLSAKRLIKRKSIQINEQIEIYLNPIRINEWQECSSEIYCTNESNYRRHAPSTRRAISIYLHNLKYVPYMYLQIKHDGRLHTISISILIFPNFQLNGMSCRRRSCY